jgi:CspA family cold shock protein
MTTKYQGTVKFYNETKGYGFITPDNAGGSDHFVHVSALEEAGLRTAKEGDRFEYVLVDSRGKKAAAGLTKI